MAVHLKLVRCLRISQLFTKYLALQQRHTKVLEIPNGGLPNVLTHNPNIYTVSRPLYLAAVLLSADEVENEENAEKEKKLKVDPSKDRSKIIPVETSLRYMESKAYKATYRDEPVWVQYRRNHKGAIPPKKTRKRCIRKNLISTGNPCPICRDEYLVVDYRNVKLLKQFISPQTGEVLETKKTGVCRVQQEALLVAIEKAKDFGYIEFDIPFRDYDYNEYFMNYDTVCSN